MEQRGFLAKNEVKKISVEEQKDWRVPEEKGGGGRVRERLAGEGKLYFLSGMGGVAGSLCFFDEGGTLRLIFAITRLGNWAQ